MRANSNKTNTDIFLISFIFYTEKWYSFHTRDFVVFTGNCIRCRSRLLLRCTPTEAERISSLRSSASSCSSRGYSAKLASGSPQLQHFSRSAGGSSTCGPAYQSCSCIGVLSPVSVCGSSGATGARSSSALRTPSDQPVLLLFLDQLYCDFGWIVTCIKKINKRIKK